MSFDFYVSIFTCGCKYRKKKCIVQILLFSYSKGKCVTTFIYGVFRVPETLQRF